MAAWTTGLPSAPHHQGEAERGGCVPGSLRRLDTRSPAWLAFLLAQVRSPHEARLTGGASCALPLPSLGNLTKPLHLWIWAALALTAGCVKRHFCF